LNGMKVNFCTAAIVANALIEAQGHRRLMQMNKLLHKCTVKHTTVVISLQCFIMIRLSPLIDIISIQLLNLA